MTHVARDEDLAEAEASFDHLDVEQAQDPFAVYQGLREKCPVVHSEQQGGFWAVLGYAETREAYNNPTCFSSESVVVPRDFQFPTMPPVTWDPPRHRTLRKLLQPTFSPRKIAQLEPEIRARAKMAVEAVRDAGKADASQDYALRIAVSAVTYLLGVPAEDEARFAVWIDSVVNMNGNGGANREAAAQSGQEMMAYFADLIQDHRDDPKNDMLAVLLEDRDTGASGADLNDEELFGSIFLFLTAGLDTAWKLIATSLYHLATHDDDRRRLVAEPDLIPIACQEFLRYYAPALMGRVATRDSELGGRQIKAGDSVLLCNQSANRDPAVFTDPEKFILDRNDTRHLAFGYGVHRCIGAPIAHLELEIAIEEWLKAIPDFRLADPTAVEWMTGQIWGVYRVDLEWDTN
jgi:hypothetical protein